MLPRRRRVRRLGAARLLRELRTDDRYTVTPRGAGQEYWSFRLGAPAGADHEAVARGVVGVLSRNGVTALTASDAH